MSNQKIKVSRKLHKENSSSDKNKILKEINKITGNQLKAFSPCALPRVVVRRSVPEFRQEAVQKSSRSSVKAFRSQASQTDLGAPNEYEGVIRYPSSRKLEVRPQREVGLQVDNSPREMTIGYTFEHNRSLVNHIKMNQIPVIKPRLATPIKKVDPCKAPPTYQRGIIPRYLQKLKEAEDKEEHIKKTSTDIKVKDKDAEEREVKMKKLASWHESYKQMVQDLNILSAAS